MTARLFSLGQWPTPLQHLQRLGAQLGGSPLWVKRDDLAGFALAGTKTRALEPLVGDALAEGCDVLVVGGGAGSNLVAATAAAARIAGMDCIALLHGRGDVPHVNLSLARWFGAQVRTTGDRRRTSVDETLPAVVDQLVEAGRIPYVIPRGGATPVGCSGTARAVAEVAVQLASVGTVPEVVVVPTGSGGIHAGLLAGSHHAGAPWRIVGMAVSRPLDETADRVGRLAADTAAMLGWEPPPASAVHLCDVRGDGFGHPSAAGREAAVLAGQTEGILLDPVYTAKAFGGLPVLLSDGVDGPVLVWHTGGVAGALSAAHVDTEAP